MTEAVILRMAASGATHVVFPGWTLAYMNADAASQQGPSDIAWLAGQSKAANLCIVAELAVLQRRKSSGFLQPPDGMGVVAVERGTVHEWRGRQLLARANADPAIHDQLTREVFEGRRTIDLGGVRFLVLVCGENSLLRNIQADSNRVALRRTLDPDWNLDALRRMDHQVVLNPAHTEFGNQGKMQRRWKWFSRPAPGAALRHCLFVTNVKRGSRGGRAIYAYRNNKPIRVQVAMDCNGWRTAVIDI